MSDVTQDVTEKPYEICFRVPGQPETLNVMLRMNTFKRRKIKAEWEKMVWLLVRNQIPKEPLRKAFITFKLYRSRFMDWDGAVGSMKPIMDGIVKAGILKDDSYKITGPWDVTQHKCKPGEEMVECRIKQIL